MKGPVEGFTPGAGGCTLRTLHWPVPNPVGRVQLVHGLSEHMGRYGLLAHALNEAGYSVWGHDHRGHGKSEGERGVVGRFQDLVADLHHLRGLADELAPGPGDPFLISHSMGALVTTRYLQERWGGGTPPQGARPLPGVVISAPWLATAVEIPLHVRLALPLLRRVAADLPVPRPIRPEVLTRDPEQAQAYARDGLVVRALAVSFYDQVRREQEAALAEGLPPGIPALVLVPQADELTDPAASAAWGARAGDAVELWSLPETRHEPFNDINRNKIFQRIVEWLDRLRKDAAGKETE
ncbi:MAG TPA: alpha/beta hydrolase [Longimicrobiales bacterium]|nr:alpha/beta hydrolase [Longimicrobiales bacterium]